MLILAAILAILGSLFFTISMTIVKQLDPAIPTSLVVFIRGCFGLLFLLPILLVNQKTAMVRTKNLYLYFLRIILGLIAMLCTYYAYRILPIAFATSIGMTSPLFIVILSSIVFKEKIGILRWGLIILGYIGIVLVVQPTCFVVDLGTLSALLANILAACCIIIVKILSKHDSTMTIMMYTNIGNIVIAFCVSINSWQTIQIKDFIILSLTGLLGTLTQICSINAVKYSSPAFVAPFEYVRIVFAALISIFIFKEILDIYMVLGTMIIIGSTYFLTIKNLNLVNR